MTLTVLSPVAETWGQTEVESVAATVVPDARPELRISLLSNSKANVDNLFRGLTESLAAESVGRVTLYDKGSSGIPMPDEMRDEIVANSDLLITAMAD
jgi:hypothetical protein